jgi:hypothetical protein
MIFRIEMIYQQVSVRDHTEICRERRQNIYIIYKSTAAKKGQQALTAKNSIPRGNFSLLLQTLTAS